MWRFLLALTVSLPCWGFNFTQDFRNGFYWASLPIGIHVVDNNPTRKALIEYLSREGIREWERGTGLDLWDESNTGTANIIRWSENFAAETNMDPLNVLAVAIRYTGGPYFARTEIIINGNHYMNQNNTNLLTTIVHELGHTMGLDHSNDFTAVMAPTLQHSYRGITLDDRNGMQAVHKETVHRQVTGFVSPLAFQTEKSGNALSCGTVAVATTSPLSGLLSLLSGILIAFVRKLGRFKSRR
jgi:hypothetical protein